MLPVRIIVTRIKLKNTSWHTSAVRNAKTASQNFNTLIKNVHTNITRWCTTQLRKIITCIVGTISYYD